MKVCSVCQRCYEDVFRSCTEDNQGLIEQGREGGREIFEGFRLDFFESVDESGEIYLGTDIDLDQTRLIKIFSPDFKAVAAAADQINRQIQLEAELLAAVDHPNVVRLFESGKLTTGELYVVMESVEGKSLRHCLNVAGLISEVTAIRIARQVAEGLQAIHETGLGHRKIDPENIILANDAENRLLVKIQNPDLGEVNRRSAISQPEQHLPELKYFAPELFTAPASDFLIDIYSLGIMLYEMLAGQTPFDAPDAAGLIDKHLHKAAPSPPISNFDIKALLEHTLSSSLQKIPAARLKNTGAFARQLRHIEQLATHSPVQAGFGVKPAVSDKPSPDFQVQTTTPPMAATVSEPPKNGDPNRPLLQKNAGEKPLIKMNADIQPEAGFKGKSAPAPKPVETDHNLIEWDQPEDIPSEAEVLELAKQEFGDPGQGPDLAGLEEARFLDDLSESKPLLTSAAPSGPVEESRVSGGVEGAIFSYQNNVFPSGFVSARRVFVGAGLIVLLVLTGSAFLYNRSLHSQVPQGQTDNDTSEKNMSRMEIKEQGVVSNNEPAKPERNIPPTPDNKIGEIEDPDLPAFGKRAIKDDPPAKIIKTPAPLSRTDRGGQRRVEKSIDEAEPKLTVGALKKTPTNGGRAKLSSVPNKKTASERKPPIQADILVRPRIVKNVKM